MKPHNDKEINWNFQDLEKDIDWSISRKEKVEKKIMEQITSQKSDNRTKRFKGYLLNGLTGLTLIGITAAMLLFVINSTSGNNQFPKLEESQTKNALEITSEPAVSYNYDFSTQALKKTKELLQREVPFYLPKNVPLDGMELSTIMENGNESVVKGITSFFTKQEQSIRIKQVKIDQSRRDVLEEHINIFYRDSKDSEKLTINHQEAYYKARYGGNTKKVFLIGDEFTISVESEQLSREELIATAKNLAKAKLNSNLSDKTEEDNVLDLYPYELSSEAQETLQTLSEQADPLYLPQQVPVDGYKLDMLFKQPVPGTEDTMNMMTSSFRDNDNNQGFFYIDQIDITPQTKAAIEEKMNVYSQNAKKSTEYEELKINGQVAYYVTTGEPTIYLVKDGFEIRIHSDYLAKEELISIAQQMTVYK